MPFCHQCGQNLELGTEKFCPACGYRLSNGPTGGNIKSTNITDNIGDTLGAGFTGNNNVIAKDTKGNILYFHIGSVTPEQLKNIIEPSTTLDSSSSFHNAGENTNIGDIQKATEINNKQGKL